MSVGNSVTKPSNHALLTVKEFAERLGLSCHWVYERTGNNPPESIPCFRFGHHIRFDDPLNPQTTEMRAWMQARQMHNHNGLKGKAGHAKEV